MKGLPSAPRAWLISLLASSPYLLIFAVQASRTLPGYRYTWFLIYDQPYYLANARAIFERGNGISYPNPYDPSYSVPSIYAHFYIWVLGFFIKVLRFSPITVQAALSVVMAVAFARATLWLVESISGVGGYRLPIFLLSMWGGGCAVAMALVGNLLQGASPMQDLLRYEPLRGWWLLPWGRNAVLTTEAFYHVLMAVAWVAVVQRKWGACAVCALILAATHPFTGLQVLAILLCDALVARLWFRHSGDYPFWLISFLALVLLAFLYYNLVFLRQFPQHRLLESTWTIDFSETPWSTLGAYGLVAPLALARMSMDRLRIDRAGAFLLTAACVSFALSHHQWFIEPRQPLHFSRGYVWMPLYLYGIPALRFLLHFAFASALRMVPACLLGAVCCADNVLWVGREYVHPSNEVGGLGLQFRTGDITTVGYLPESLLRLFKQMDDAGLSGVLISDDIAASFLAATFTGCRPYYGHWANTPHYEMRLQRVRAWFDGALGHLKPGVFDYVLTRGSLPAMEISRFKLALRSGEWTLYMKEDEKKMNERLGGSGEGRPR